MTVEYLGAADGSSPRRRGKPGVAHASDLTGRLIPA